MRLFAVINQKGGVGKTTTVANLAYALAERGKQVTVIDLDPQGSLSASLGIDTRNVSGIDDVLINEAEISDVLVMARENLYLVPAGKNLRQLEQHSDGSAAQAKNLKTALKDLDDQDFVFIDCPPASGFLTFKQWVVITRFHQRRKLARDVFNSLVEHFPKQVLKTPIRETSALAESPSFGKTVFEYRGSSNGAEDYFSLATDLIKGRTL